MFNKHLIKYRNKLRREKRMKIASIEHHHGAAKVAFKMFCVINK